VRTFCNGRRENRTTFWSRASFSILSPGRELQAVIAKLAGAAEPGAVWLIADFTIPRQRFARAHARLWLRMMYMFFRATSGIAANELVDPIVYLDGHGFIRASESLSRGSMLRSNMYVAWEQLV
jgi:hypothetical protein